MSRVVQSIKSKAIGLDGVHIVFVKIILPFILPVLTHIINYCFTTSRTPKCWKLDKVIPNHKKTRSRGFDDFRPLSILPCLSKVLEVLAKEQLVKYLLDIYLLNCYQSGYRARHSTEGIPQGSELGFLSFTVYQWPTSIAQACTVSLIRRWRATLLFNSWKGLGRCRAKDQWGYWSSMCMGQREWATFECQ